jgi:hypothetical protein
MSYISFRKRFILPVRYFFEGVGIMRKMQAKDQGEAFNRIEEYRKQLVTCQKKKLKDEADKLEIRIEELTWVYGNSEA